MPFVVFLPTLAATSRQGLLRCGVLATRYHNCSLGKRCEAKNLAGTELLGTGDIQSIADIGNSVDRIENMKFLPIIGEGRAELSMLPDPRRDCCDTDPRRAPSSTRSGLVFDKGQGDSFPHYPIRRRS
jgi:hypothetical protein